MNSSVLWTALFAAFPATTAVLPFTAHAECRVPGQVAPRKIHRGVYVCLQRDSETIPNLLGNPQAENELLSFVTKQKIDSLSLYDLHKVLANESSRLALRELIAAARECGVTEIAAVGAVHEDWRRIKQYQQEIPDAFDGLLTEIEFWNTDPVAESFTNFVSELQYMRLLDILPSITPYIGWLGQDGSLEEAQTATQIAENVTRVFVHAYVDFPEQTYENAKSRLHALRSANPELPIWPIFSAEEDEMGPWLAEHSLDEAEAIFMKAYAEDMPSSQPGPAGFEYFEYDRLKAHLR